MFNAVKRRSSMETTNIKVYSQATIMGNALPLLLLIGSVVRIPISSTAAISASDVLLIFVVFSRVLTLKGGLLRVSRLERDLLPVIVVVTLVSIAQVVIHFHRAGSVMWLFLHLYLGILYLIGFGRARFSHVLYYKALIAFALYLGIGSLYLSTFNFVEGRGRGLLSFASANYSSAVMLIIIPAIVFYWKRKISSQFDVWAKVSLILMFISIILSGSRVNIVVLLFQLIVILFFVQIAFAEKLRMISGLVIVAIVSFVLVTLVNPELSSVIERQLQFFGHFFEGNQITRNDILHSDIARENLRNEALSQINENRFFGTGLARAQTMGEPPHNFIYEILLGLGFVGLTVYLVYLASYLISLYRRLMNSKFNRRLFLIMVVSFFLIAWFQPFLTTGKEFGVVFWLNITAFYDFSRQRT